MLTIRDLSRRSVGGHRRLAGRGGFTLVEVLVTIAIISILAGLVTVSLQQARKFADLKKTRVEIQSLEQAAIAYKNAFGDYPPSSLAPLGIKPNGTNDGIESLIVHANARMKGGPFLEALPDDRLENYDGDRLSTKNKKSLAEALNHGWDTAELLEYVDLWGTPFVYVHHRDYAYKKSSCQGEDGNRMNVSPARSEKTGTYQKPTSFQIWSCGPNRMNENGGGDDISSWSD